MGIRKPTPLGGIGYAAPSVSRGIERESEESFHLSHRIASDVLSNVKWCEQEPQSDGWMMSPPCLGDSIQSSVRAGGCESSARRQKLSP